MLGNIILLLLSFLFFSSALPACLTSRRPLQVFLGDAQPSEAVLHHDSAPLTGYHTGGCRDVYQHNFPLRGRIAGIDHHYRSLAFLIVPYLH